MSRQHGSSKEALFNAKVAGYVIRSKGAIVTPLVLSTSEPYDYTDVRVRPKKYLSRLNRLRMEAGEDVSDAWVDVPKGNHPIPWIRMLLADDCEIPDFIEENFSEFLSKIGENSLAGSRARSNASTEQALASLQSQVAQLTNALKIQNTRHGKENGVSSNVDSDDDGDVPSEEVKAKKKKTPRQNRRNTKTRQYSEENQAAALDAVRKTELGRREASRTFKVPYSTIREKLKGEQLLQCGDSKPLFCQRGTEPALDTDTENVLVFYLKQMDERGFPLNCSTFRNDVPKILNAAGIENPFTNRTPSEGWFYSRFLKRHPSLSMHKAQYHSSARANVSTEELFKWYSEISDYLVENDLAEEYDSSPELVWNMDETAMYLNDSKDGIAYLYCRKTWFERGVTV
ncbi:Hypothetical predicted protein [Cloeon dipterum]|uniref:HTH psq-type domain-containing protein n=1 Tax=Cloeon dipterum TaxID=197152 RepID=A0A8S1DZD9_9INSE|nr:Hypothetical predicted protein [Cloeon dipterum]